MAVAPLPVDELRALLYIHGQKIKELLPLSENML
jgi:hypothetical protein